MSRGPRKSRHILCPDRVCEIIDAHHLTLGEVAGLVGMSRSFWSQLLNNRRGVSPKMRTRIRACPVFAGVPDAELWQRCEATP